MLLHIGIFSGFNIIYIYVHFSLNHSATTTWSRPLCPGRFVQATLFALAVCHFMMVVFELMRVVRLVAVVGAHPDGHCLLA